MKIERYLARDSKSAMAKVRAELGTEAFILANRKVGDQVEITAALDLDDLVEASPTATATVAKLAPVSQVEVPANELKLKSLERELQRLRGMLEQELGNRSWRESAQGSAPDAALRQRLLRLGLSRTLTGQLMDRLPAFRHLNHGWELALAALAKEIPVVAPDSDPTAVTALFGGTGVGKTSTIAKLAGHDILRFGPENVGLITLDSYRIGAQEQLASFAEALSIPLHLAHDSHSLSLALRELRGRRIYIDTPGVAPNDARIAHHIAMLRGQRTAVNAFLVLSASAQPSLSSAMARSFAPSTLSGAIICKTDEAPSLGGVLDVLVRTGLPLHCTTQGQRVPEDVVSADPGALVARAASLLDARDVPAATAAVG